MTISPSAGAATLTYASGAGTSTLIYNISRTVVSSETATISYTQPGNGIENVSGGADVASFSAQAVTNNSTQTPVTPTWVSSVVNGTVLTDTYSVAVTHGAGGTGGKALTMSGGAVTATYASGAGSTALTYTLSRAVANGETGTSAYTQPGNGIEAVSGGGDLATYSGQTVTNSTPPTSGAETTFDSLYGAWTPITNTTYYARPSQADPNAKATTTATPSYTDTNFGTKIYQATRVSDGDAGLTYLRHEYSRKPAFNCDNTRFIAVSSSGWWYLYDANTFARLDGGRTSSPGTGGLGTGTTGGFAGDCEPIWHPTNPNKIWYMDQNGGMITYEFDITTKTRTTYIDWSPIIASLGASWSSVARVWWQGEGRPSDDGDVWGMSCQTSVFNQVGLIMYRKSTNTVLGSLLTTNKPNNVSTSRSGTYCVPSWANGAGLTMTTAAAASVNATDGTRAYTANFGSFQQMSYYGEHADTALDALGNDVYVSINYNVGSMPDVSDGYIYYRRMDNGTAYELSPGYTGSSYAWHMSGFCDGFALIGSYAGEPGSAWKDEVLIMAQLVTSAPKRLRVAHHQSNYSVGTGAGEDNYWGEPHSTCNRYGTRIMFASNFRNSVSTYERSFMIGLPSDWKTRI